MRTPLIASPLCSLLLLCIPAGCAAARIGEPSTEESPDAVHEVALAETQSSTPPIAALGPTEQGSFDRDAVVQRLIKRPFEVFESDDKLQLDPLPGEGANTADVMKCVESNLIRAVRWSEDKSSLERLKYSADMLSRAYRQRKVSTRIGAMAMEGVVSDRRANLVAGCDAISSAVAVVDEHAVRPLQEEVADLRQIEPQTVAIEKAIAAAEALSTEIMEHSDTLVAAEADLRGRIDGLEQYQRLLKTVAGTSTSGGFKHPVMLDLLGQLIIFSGPAPLSAESEPQQAPAPPSGPHIVSSLSSR